jgi:hypothetical protein
MTTETTTPPVMTTPEERAQLVAERAKILDAGARAAAAAEKEHKAAIVARDRLRDEHAAAVARAAELGQAARAVVAATEARASTITKQLRETCDPRIIALAAALRAAASALATNDPVPALVRQSLWGGDGPSPAEALAAAARVAREAAVRVAALAEQALAGPALNARLRDELRVVREAARAAGFTRLDPLEPDALAQRYDAILAERTRAATEQERRELAHAVAASWS